MRSFSATKPPSPFHSEHLQPGSCNFTLSHCSCWVPVRHSPDVFFPDNNLFWTASRQEQGVSLLPFVISVSMCSSTLRMFRFSMLLKDESRKALGIETVPLWGRGKMAAQHLSWKLQRQKHWNQRIPSQILTEMRTVRGPRAAAAAEQRAVCLACSWLPRKRVSCHAITSCPQKKLRKHRSSSTVSKPQCCGWADHSSGATPEKLGICQSWRRLAVMEKRAWCSKKWDSLGCGLISLAAGSSGSLCGNLVGNINGKVIFVLDTVGCLCQQIPSCTPSKFYLLSVAFP